MAFVASARCFCFVLLVFAFGAEAAVVINEVAPKSAGGVCDGADWVELFNNGDAEASIASYQLCDRQGCAHIDALTFAADSKIAAKAYQVVCSDNTSANAFNFSVQADDIITLQDAIGYTASTSGALTGRNDGKTWARLSTDSFAYVNTATPGAINDQTVAVIVASTVKNPLPWRVQYWECPSWQWPVAVFYACLSCLGQGLLVWNIRYFGMFAGTRRFRQLLCTNVLSSGSWAVVMGLRCSHVGGTVHSIAICVGGASLSLGTIFLYSILKERALALASTNERVRFRCLPTVLAYLGYLSMSIAICCWVGGFIVSPDVAVRMSNFQRYLTLVECWLIRFPAGGLFCIFCWKDIRTLRVFSTSQWGCIPGHAKMIKSLLDSVQHVDVAFAFIMLIEVFCQICLLPLWFEAFNEMWYYLFHVGCQSGMGCYYFLACLIIFRSGPCVQSMESERKRKAILNESRKKYTEGQDAGWQNMVRSLGDKGISLEAVIVFYKKLPTIMHNFDPKIHRTKDVVRAAIIPATVDGKCALSEQMMKHSPTPAKIMVTHCWQNLFRDLIASIIADALEWPYYEEVAEMMDSDIEQLERILSPQQLSLSYWICAFCVNQHECICGGNPYGDADPVSREVFPCCSCSAPKYFNATPPLRADGKSTNCQMNKFDDMMAYMSWKDADFRHLIAVGRGFILFGRCWCIAEIVQAAMLGLPQSMIICSLDSLTEHTELKNLKIENMEAARKEDVEDIISSIPDLAYYNSLLQDILFNEDRGLLAFAMDPQATTSFSKLAKVALVGPKLAAAAAASRAQKFALVLPSDV